MSMRQELATQRWDDHRYYHQCRINQSLHFVSAASFLIAYAFLLINPATAALIAWGISMTTRQAGHFFFEPRGYDVVNQVTDEYKEAVKVGYNIRRKTVLMGVWAAIPLALWLEPSLGGLIEPAKGLSEYGQDVGTAWLILGVIGVLFRVGQLWVTQDLRTGLIWALKIITDPFHDLMLYWRAPLALLRGERLDPMHHIAR
jgi:multisubunit Na+/H+ antiporter MnhG subunit